MLFCIKKYLTNNDLYDIIHTESKDKERYKWKK